MRCYSIVKLLKRVFMKQKPRNASQNATKRNAIPRHSFTMWRHRCKQHRVSVGNTELPYPELLSVMLVTPAGVTLEVVGGPTQVYNASKCSGCEDNSRAVARTNHSWLHQPTLIQDAIKIQKCVAMRLQKFHLTDSYWPLRDYKSSANH